MPVSAYFRGKGKSVLRDMTSRYGPEKGKRVFYATAKKMGLERPGKKRAKSARG